MKAYKQINNSFEYKIVFSYAGLMSLLSFFILLSPVFSQEDKPIQKNEPKIHYDVKKEFDKDGNLTGYDSTFSWYWSDRGFGIHDFDSLFEEFDQNFNFLGDQRNWSGVHPFGGLPHDSPFWNWNGEDSSGVFQQDSIFNRFFYKDPLNYSFFDFDDFSDFFDHRIDIEQYFEEKGLNNKHFEQELEFWDKIKEYQKENQKLIEKYFGKPDQFKETEPQCEPQKLSSPPSPSYPNKSGKI